jgi:ParB-like nuclease domain
MRTISTDGFEKPKAVYAGAAPALGWVPIVDLVVDPSYRRPLADKCARNINRIAAAFSWSRFTPVVVAPWENGKFVIIDGESRATAAALAGFDAVPCQIIVASREEQAAAFKAINCTGATVSRMASHAAALRSSDPKAVRLAEVCMRAEVSLLRYPVPVSRQVPGQTMAVGAIAYCLKRYGEETLITALQCVTQTTNNQPGALSARMIKAMCDVLDGNILLRDSGLALLEAFDAIDLLALQREAARTAAVRRLNPLPALIERIRCELDQLLPVRIVGVRAIPQTSLHNAVALQRPVPSQFHALPRLSKS